MADDKLTEPRDPESYRRATAKRVAEVYEVQVDATDDRSFIESLEAAGLMVRVPSRAAKKPQRQKFFPMKRR